METVKKVCGFLADRKINIRYVEILILISQNEGLDYLEMFKRGDYKSLKYGNLKGLNAFREIISELSGCPNIVVYYKKYIRKGANKMPRRDKKIRGVQTGLYLGAEGIKIVRGIENILATELLNDIEA